MQSENITIIMIIFLNKKLSASTLDFYVANRLKQWYNFKEDLLVAVFFLSVLSILHLRETGILNILMTWHPSPVWKRQKKHHHASNSFEGGVQIVQVVPILSLYAASIILAFFLLILETATAMHS